MGIRSKWRNIRCKIYSKPLITPFWENCSHNLLFYMLKGLVIPDKIGNMAREGTREGQHPPPPKKRQKRVIWSFELASKCRCGVKSPKEAWTLLRRWCIWSMQDINTFLTLLDTCLNALYHCVRAVRLNKFRSLWRDTHESDYMIRMNHWQLSCYNTLIFSYLRVYLPVKFPIYIYI